jgi:hypothetical protein
MTDDGGPVAVPTSELINATMEEAREVMRAGAFAAVNMSWLDSAHSVVGQLMRRLEEAQKVVALYWDGFDLLNDGPDDEDRAHANATINEAHRLGEQIALAHRIRNAPRPPPPPLARPSGERPANCRNRLRDEGKPYPRSGCLSCKDGGLRGCPYERPA